MEKHMQPRVEMGCFQYRVSGNMSQNTYMQLEYISIFLQAHKIDLIF